MSFIKKNKIKIFSVNKKLLLICVILCINIVNRCASFGFRLKHKCHNDKCIYINNNIEKFSRLQKTIAYGVIGHLAYRKLLRARISYLWAGAGCCTLLSSEFCKMIQYGHIKNCKENSNIV
jgi:hypothetical protein